MDRVFIIPFAFSNKQQINREANNPHHYKESECRSTRSGASAGSSGEQAHIPAHSSVAVADSPAAGIPALGRADSLVRDSPAADSPDSAASAPDTFSLGNRRAAAVAARATASVAVAATAPRRARSRSRSASTAAARATAVPIAIVLTRDERRAQCEAYERLSFNRSSGAVKATLLIVRVKPSSSRVAGSRILS